MKKGENMKERKNKYNNKKIKFMDHDFASQDELKYYKYLLTHYTQEQIILQPKFNLQPKFKDQWTNKTIREINYIADFQVGNIIIDVKGWHTIDFKLKAKIFKYKYSELNLIVGTSKYLIEQKFL